MLKCVVFVVTEYGFRYLEKHRKSIDETLNGAGVKTVFLAYEETDAFAEKEVLYITDNSKTLKNLLKKIRKNNVFLYWKYKNYKESYPCPNGRDNLFFIS